MTMPTFLRSAALLLIAMAPIVNAGLILNGGFELTDNGYSNTLTPMNWTNVGHSDGVIAYAMAGTPAYDGAYYYDLGGFGMALPNVGDGIQQTVSTTVGTTYTLSFGLTSENMRNDTEYLNVYINGTLLQSYLLTQDSAYGTAQKPFTTQSIDYTATSSSAIILFTVSGTNRGFNDPMIDAVNFDISNGPGPGPSGEAPEPATCITGLVGLGLLALRKLR